MDSDSSGDRFFEDITSLYRRQTMMFQHSCDQLKDICDLESPTPSSASTLPMSSKTTTTQPSPSPFGEIETKDVESLYVDCLHTVFHMVGCDADRDAQFAYAEHLRKAFKIDPKRHLFLYEAAEERPAPRMRLNLTIAEARNLATKDISGLNDPFCTFRIKSRNESFSDQQQINNTGCKMRTLDPVWNESFEVVLGSRIDEGDVLHVDVWNFLPSDEKFREKLKRIGEVRDPRGFKQYVVDAVNAVNKGQQQLGHKLIGSVEVPLRSLPSCGYNKWWTLEKKAEKVSELKFKLSHVRKWKV
jgi:hypothetical protein